MKINYVEHHNRFSDARIDVLLQVVLACAQYGYADGAYIYSRMMARHYHRVMCSRAWREAMVSFYGR